MITASSLIAKVQAIGADETAAKLLSVGAASDSTQAKFAKLAVGGALVLGATLAVLGAKVASMAGNFESATTRLVTSAGEQSSNIGRVRSAILGLSIDTATGTDQLIKAWYMASSAGYNFAHGGLDVVRAAAMGARAENADLGKVTDVLTTAMHNYHLPVSQAVDVMNSYIRATAEGKMTMDDLTGALRNVLPIASIAKVKLGDVEGALATMSLAGDKGTAAGTHLAQMLTYLLSPSSKASGVLKEVGLTTQGIADEMKRSLPGALEMITDAVGKKFPVGSAKYIAALSAIVGGNRSMKAMLELSGGSLQDFLGHVNKISPALSANSRLIEKWGTIQGNFNFKLDQAKEVAEMLGIKIGSVLLPVLGRILGVVTPVIAAFSNWAFSGHALSDVLGFLKQHADILVPAAAGVGAIIVAAVVPALIGLAGAAWAAAAGVIAATWPFLLIGAAVAGAVAIFKHFYDTSAPFKQFIDGIVVGVKQAAQWIQANFIPALQQLGKWLQSNVLPILQQVGQFLMATFKPLWQQLVAVWQGQILPALKQLWAALTPLMPVLKLLGGIILGIVVVSLGLLVGILAGVVRALAGFLSGVAVVIGGIIKIFTGIVQIISGVVRFIYDLLTGNFGALKGDLATIWSGIVNVFSGAWDVIKGIFMAAWGAISGFVSGLVEGIIGFFTHLWQALVGHSIIPDMINGIISFFASLPGRVFALVSSLVSKVLAFFGFLKDQAISKASELVSGFISAVSALPGRALSLMGQLKDKVLGALGDLAGQALSAGAHIVQSIASGILGAISGALGGAMSAVGGFISSHLPHSPAKVGPLRDLPLQSRMITEQIAAGLLAGSPKIQAAMGSLLKPVSMSVGISGTSGAAYRFPTSQTTIVNHITVNPELTLDGYRLTRQQMPYIVNAIRTRTGTKF